MTHLDLFSGIGGFALAAGWAGIETVGFCEVDEYCRDVLRKNFPELPIHNDIRELDGDEFGSVDIITGGYPCQPFSLAGNRVGGDDKRHLWPEMLRIIRRAKPSWVVCENVFGHISMGLDEVCNDLERNNYSVRSYVVPAISKGAPHKRDRVWIVACLSDSASSYVEKRTEKSIPGVENIQIEFRRMGEVVGIRTKQGEPDICGAFDGISKGLDEDRKERLIGLGNAIVPQVAYEFLRCIREVEQCVSRQYG